MLFAAGLSLSVSAQVANVKVTVTPLGDKLEGRHEVPFSSTTSDILVNENFEAMTKGTPEAPDFQHSAGFARQRRVYQSGADARLTVVRP